MHATYDWCVHVRVCATDAPAGLSCFSVSVLWYSALPRELYKEELNILAWHTAVIMTAAAGPAVVPGGTAPLLR